MSTVGHLARQFGKDVRVTLLILGKFGSLERMRTLVGVTKINKSPMSP